MGERVQRTVLNGTGVGLRGPHVPQILKEKPVVPWFELLTDNHLSRGGAVLYQAAAIAERYPVALHGVGMSLGGVDPLNWEYIAKVRALAESTGAMHISEHLSFTSGQHIHSHELLPLPKTEEAICHVAARISHIQEFLGQQILIENVSTYLEFRDDAVSEAEFITEICKRADCYLLLDVNNIYVNAINHDREAADLLQNMPWARVKEIHVAGHSRRGALLVDTHGGPVCSEVADLMAIAVTQAPAAPVLLEWDTELPTWESLWTEGQRINALRTSSILADSA